MAFRNSGSTGGGGGTGTIAPGTPTKSIEIGDLFEQGSSGKYADADHQHALAGPAAGSAQPLTNTSGEGGATAPARADHTHAHNRLQHLAGGHADLSGDFPTFTSGDGRWAPLVHGGRHARNGPDDLSALYVPFDLVDNKGDLLVGNADNQLVRVPIGANDQVLQADSTVAGGMKWGSPLAPTAETASTIKLRAALQPDGFELYYGWSNMTIDATANTFTVPQQRLWVGGFPVDIQANTVVSITRPASGTRKDGIYARIDNANGGWSSPSYVFRAGTSSLSPSPTKGDLSSATGVYEYKVAEILNVPSGTTPTFTDLRKIVRGFDGGDQSGMMLINQYTVVSDSPSIQVQTAYGATAFRALRLIGSLRAANGATDPRLTWVANFGAGTQTYDLLTQVASGSTTTTATNVNMPSGTIGDLPPFNATAPYAMAHFESLIANPATPTGKKTLRSQTVRSLDDAPALQTTVSNWFEATPLSNLTLAIVSGNIAAGGYVALYGQL